MLSHFSKQTTEKDNLEGKGLDRLSDSELVTLQKSMVDTVNKITETLRERKS